KQFFNGRTESNSLLGQGYSIDIFPIEHTLKNVFGISQDELDQLSREEWTTKISELMELSPNHPSYPYLIEASVIRDALKFEKEEDILNVFKEASTGLDYNGKMRLLSRVLKTLADGYDDLRAVDGSSESEGIVSFEDVFQNWRHNSKFKDKQVAGVCRDIAMAGVKISKAMGIKISYALGYQTTGDGHHRINLNSEGKNKGITLYNYGEGTQNNKIRGIKALQFNGSLPSSGIKFRIYNVDSKLAAVLPSELGIVLNEIMGGDDKTLSVSQIRKPSLHQIGVRTPYGKLRVFASNSSQGTLENTSGISYNIDQPITRFIELSGGISFYSSSRDTQYGTLHDDGFAYRLSPRVKLDETFKTTGTRVNLQVAPQIFGVKNCTELNNKSCTGNSDSYNTIHLLAEVEQSFGDKVSLTLSSEGNTFTSSSESTDNESPDEIRVTNYSLGAGLLFKPTLNSRISIDGKIIYTDLGDAIYKTYQTNMKFEQTNWQTRLSLAHHGSLQDNTPEFIPGSGETTNINLRQGLHFLPIKIGTYGEYNHDDPKYSILGLSIGNK
ncbi:MAG: hypothetical protein HOJ35_04130, partial [Bdellovibrionales bacterium]|nr:hypothetical protein [Bdellovibrionales bacterium]